MVELSAEDIVARSIARYEAFLTRTSASVHDIDGVDVAEVFTRYFAGAAPLSEGKKKSEFPDAFAMLAFENWLASHQWDRRRVDRRAGYPRPT